MASNIIQHLVDEVSKLTAKVSELEGHIRSNRVYIKRFAKDLCSIEEKIVEVDYQNAGISTNCLTEMRRRAAKRTPEIKETRS